MSSHSHDAGRGDFATTHWSVVLSAGDEDDEHRSAALAQLCEDYWYPLYAFARRRGHQPQDAQELTQAFFAVLLEKNYVGSADAELGRFRAFLITAFKRFLSKEYDRQATVKRGGSVQFVSLNASDGESRFQVEPSHNDTPDRLFDRRWALLVTEYTMNQLATEYEQAGKTALFKKLQPALTHDIDAPSHTESADQLEMSVSAVRVALHRLRKRYQEILRAEVMKTVAHSADVEDELRDLVEALRM